MSHNYCLENASYHADCCTFIEDSDADPRSTVGGSADRPREGSAQVQPEGTASVQQVPHATVSRTFKFHAYMLLMYDIT